MTNPGQNTQPQEGDDAQTVTTPVQPYESSGTSPPEAEAAPAPQAEKAHRVKRTPGLRLVDAVVYPGINNLGVFGISVLATYLTTKGGPDVAGKLPFGKTGEFFFKRGEWMKGKFKSFGMNENQAAMGKMVFFSFADGTLVAPFVKLLEDRREQMAKWIDDKLGTRPKNDAVYEGEPHQTWGSVVEGRLLTSLVVVPTAVALDKAGLNDVLFSNPGEKMGEKIAKNPKIAKFFGKLDTPELFKTIYFEAFYTSVCTAGLYFISRAIARFRDTKKQEREEHAQRSIAAPTETTQTAPREPEVTSPANEKTPATEATPTITATNPANTIVQPHLLERLHAPLTQEVMA